MTATALPMEGARSLSEFEPLLPAELVVLRALASGGIAKIGFQRPRVATPEVTLRAAFLAFVVRGQAMATTAEAASLQVLGAWITGPLQLTRATLPMGLWLYRCTLAATPVFDEAHVAGSLSFSDCTLPGLRVPGCHIAGSLSLNAGCQIEGPVRLDRATVAGHLDLERSQLCTTRMVPRALVADHARIGGDVNLSHGFCAQGELRFRSARISGDLRASQANLTAHLSGDSIRGTALCLDDAQVAGSVFLNAGFSAAGQLRLARARIEGDLDGSSASFDMMGDTAWDSGTAVLMDHARIGGTLLLRHLPTPLQGASLAHVRAGALADDLTTWGQRHVLDGFTYRRLAVGAPTDAAMRLRWLARQHAPHVGVDHRPQPWSQLIAVLRSMGHRSSANSVAMGREQHLREIDFIGRDAAAPWGGLLRAGHDAWGLLAGHGYRPMRLVALLFTLWLACSALYWAAAEHGLMAPSNLAVFADPRLAHCRAGTPNHWVECTELPAVYPRFNPWLYSLDQLIPGLGLRQAQAWSPLTNQALGSAAALLGGLEAVCGVAGLLLLLACITGLTERSRRP